ncbi:MAG: cytochrome P450 [Gammaproteobacteria bacterium]
MTEFIPPYPARFKKKIGSLEILYLARKDLLSIWGDDAFHFQFREKKIFNRHVFIANCPEVVRYVLVTQHNIYQQKSSMMQKALQPLLDDSLFINHGEVWRTRRQMIATLFTNSLVARYADIMISTIAETAHRWSLIPPGSNIEVLPEMEKLAVEIICRTLFGRQLGDYQATEIIQAFHIFQTSIEQMDMASFFGFPTWLPNFQWGQSKRAAERIHKIVDGYIAGGIEERCQGSILDMLLEANRKSGTEILSSKQIRNELIMLFLAGHETTANTLAWTWYLISQRADVEQRLHEEIEQVLGSRPPSYEDIPKLIYTRAILDESMRLYPPVPILSRQANTDDIIRNRKIPAGSIMLVVPWLLHRHRLYWEKPDHFMPERFLPGEASKHEPYAYLPFSTGPRSCLGKTFSLIEATLCIATLAQRFRLDLPQGHQVSHDCRLTLRPKNNLPMRLEQR